MNSGVTSSLSPNQNASTSLRPGPALATSRSRALHGDHGSRRVISNGRISVIVGMHRGRAGPCGRPQSPKVAHDVGQLPSVDGDVGQRPARPHVEGVVRRRGDAALQAHRGGQRDHRAVVGAQRQLRVVHAHAALARSRIQAAARRRRWRRRRRPRPGASGRVSRSARIDLLHQHVDDRRLRRRGQVGALPARTGCGAELAQLRQHRRLQAGEREVEVAAVQQRPRQRERAGIALRGQPRQRRPAGVAQAQQLGASCRRPRRRRRRWSRRAARSARPRRRASAACARPRPAARRTETAAGRPTGTATAGGLRGGARRAPACPAPRPARRPRRRPPARRRPARARACRPPRRCRPARSRPAASTWRVSGSTRRMWSREASSGTTPP